MACPTRHLSVRRKRIRRRRRSRRRRRRKGRVDTITAAITEAVARRRGIRVGGVLTGPLPRVTTSTTRTRGTSTILTWRGRRG